MNILKKLLCKNCTKNKPHVSNVTDIIPLPEPTIIHPGEFTRTEEDNGRYMFPISVVYSTINPYTGTICKIEMGVHVETQLKSCGELIPFIKNKYIELLKSSMEITIKENTDG